MRANAKKSGANAVATRATATITDKARAVAGRFSADIFLFSLAADAASANIDDREHAP